MSQRIAITGIGAVTPLGIGATSLHTGGVEGASGIHDGFGRCQDFNAADYLGRRDARRLDRFAQLALVAATEAIEQAGLADQTHYEPERIATIVGTAIGGLHTIEKQIEEVRINGIQASSPLSVPMLMANAAPAQIALRFGFKGEASALIAACSGGAQAILAGIRTLRGNDADVAVVGGAEASLTKFTQSIFLSAGALSPSGLSRPFHRQRDGFVMGEGAGILVLERWEEAQRRNSTILGEIVGYGATTDAFHITAPDPSATQATRAMVEALSSAKATPEQVGYINAHGTGTVLNDAIEAQALSAALGERVSETPVSSSKSYIGHLVGAAGAVELIVTLLALRNRLAPATRGLDDIDPSAAMLDHVLAPRELNSTAPLGISNSFGFGGHNVALVVKAT